jgi:hypothetical protein
LLTEIWGPHYRSETSYLRVYLAQLPANSNLTPRAPATSSPNPAWAIASNHEIHAGNTAPALVTTLRVALFMTATLAVTGCSTNVDTSNGQNDYTISDPVTSLRIDIRSEAPKSKPRRPPRSPLPNSSVIRATATTSHMISGGELTLRYNCPSGLINVSVNVCSVTYVIMVPRQLAVHINGEVGETKLSGLAGPLTLTSGTGSINATGLTSPTVTARASAGTIGLAFTAPPTTVDAQT